MSKSINNRTVGKYEIFITRLQKKGIYPWLYVIPIILFVFIYKMIPMLFSTGLSFFEWNGIKSILQAEFIGLKNYINLPNDPIFLTAFKNTVIFVVVVFIFQNLFGLSHALILFYSGIKFSKIWRAIIFFPVIISPVIIGMVFRVIFASDGLVNEILGKVGLDFLQVIWLANKVTPIFVIIVVYIWQMTGYNMVLYYAGLQAIPEELIEVARIDGANWSGIIGKVIIPLLSPVITIVVILNLTWAFRVFDIVYVLTRGGPVHASEVFSTYLIYNSFSELGPDKMGYASTIAVVLTTIILILSYLRFRFTKTVGE